MSKFTPGPWKVVHAGPKKNNTFVRYILREADNSTLFDAIAGIKERHAGEGITEANARLIAAAPEMLEALKWTMQTVHQAHHDGSMHDCGKTICIHLREVIAQAEGHGHE